MNRSIIFSAALHASLLGTFLIVGARTNFSIDGIRQSIHEATAPDQAAVAETPMQAAAETAALETSKEIAVPVKTEVKKVSKAAVALPAKKAAVSPAKRINEKVESAAAKEDVIAENLDAEAQKQDVTENDKVHTVTESKSEEQGAEKAEEFTEARVAVQKVEETKEEKAANHADLREEMIRPLSELRALPGNPVPQYEDSDRMAGRSGTVVFWAEVREDGSLANFDLQESSGHRELDAKTLKALKQWKFASGQAGFVELPFQWDLTGGVQELPALRGKSLPRSAR